MTIIHTTPTPIPLPRTPTSTPVPTRPLPRRRSTRPAGPPSGARAEGGAGLPEQVDQMNGEIDDQ